jgi:hypothetical protein
MINMFQYIKTLFQLILFPNAGWEDVSATGADPELMLRKGLYPLLGITACSEFVQLFFNRTITFVTAMELAIVCFGAYFATIFIAKLIFELYVKKFVQGEINNKKNMTLIAVIVGIMALLKILSNCLPEGLTLIKFLPFYVMMIIYKACPYMAVKQENEITFVLLATGATIVIPLLLNFLLSSIII